MKNYDTICQKCGGLIPKPGVIYGWGGTFCACPDEPQQKVQEEKCPLNPTHGAHMWEPNGTTDGMYICKLCRKIV